MIRSSRYNDSMTSMEEEPQRRLRIAWIGTPTPGGGVGGFCRQLVEGLASTEHEIVVFAQGNEEVEKRLGWELGNVEFVYAPIDWDWGRWYSRSDIAVFISSFWARIRSYKRLISMLEEKHNEKRFDVVIQFSQTELFSAKKRLKFFPPFILFPCVHAAGELLFHNRERGLSRRCESRFKYWLVNLNLRQRSYLQKRAYSAVYGVIGMSRRFNEWVRKDYHIEAENQAVVYQPIPDGLGCGDDLSTSEGVHPNAGKVRLLFVGRISVRKGIEMLVELSHRIADLAEKVEITIVGTSSHWSNYNRLLDELNPKIARHVVYLPHQETLKEMQRSDFLLVPSHYEPGGIVVAEAVGMGCGIVSSDEVGSAENLPEGLCYRFPAGNMKLFEDAVRKAVDGKFSARNLPSRKDLRAIAEKHFCPAKTTSDLVKVCFRAANRQPIGGIQ
jgi:glycosyltransferase involved in cell wall biosynthesis